jgi:malonate transporter
MFIEIFNVVAPVFIVVGAGYAAVRAGLVGDDPIDHIMNFAIRFAIPCLLFRATSTIDLALAFDWRLLFDH